MPVTAKLGPVVALAVVLVASGCGGGTGAERPTGALREVDTESGARTATEPEILTTSIPGPPGPAVPGRPSDVGAGFKSSIQPVPESVRARMDGVSMRPGCPVGYDDLRYVRVTHVDGSGASVEGELVVAAHVAEQVVGVFEELHRIRFPVTSMRLVDDFGPAGDPDDGADDFASIEADNTSAFNCRLRTGSDVEYSEHSFGTAIDVNPLKNPYVSRSGTTSHPRSVPYLDRSDVRAGMVVDGDEVVKAFESIGWSWGGHWQPPVDHQHFSAGGR